MKSPTSNPPELMLVLVATLAVTALNFCNIMVARAAREALTASTGSGPDKKRSHVAMKLNGH
jgi:hypothetical protein